VGLVLNPLGARRKDPIKIDVYKCVGEECIALRRSRRSNPPLIQPAVRPIILS